MRGEGVVGRIIPIPLQDFARTGRDRLDRAARVGREGVGWMMGFPCDGPMGRWPMLFVEPRRLA